MTIFGAPEFYSELIINELHHPKGNKQNSNNSITLKKIGEEIGEKLEGWKKNIERKSI